MNDRIKWTMLECFTQSAVISDVAFNQVIPLELFMLLGMFEFELWTVEGVEVVQGHHFAAIRKQPVDKMAAYKPRAAGDQDFFDFPVGAGV